MTFPLRPLLSCALAGAGLLLLSGCGEYDDGRDYHRHAYGDYRSGGRYYEDGYRRTTYDRGYRDDGYDRRPRYETDTRVVINETPRNYGSRYHDSAAVAYNEPTRSKYGNGQRGGSYNQAAVSQTQNRGYHQPTKTGQGNRSFNPNAGRPPATNHPPANNAPPNGNHAPVKGKKKDPNADH